MFERDDGNLDHIARHGVRLWEAGVAIRWQRELPHWLLIWAMFALAAFAWDAAPDALPVHWNLAGEPDRFSGKVEGLLALPVIALVMYLVLLVAPLLMSARPEQLGAVYTGIRFAVLLMLAALYVLILLSIRGVPIDMTRAATLLVGVLLIGIGGVMGRMRPNAVMGVRTPWTLASQAAWDASQRLGGWLFVAIGALLALGGLLGAPWLMVAGIVVLILGTPALIWYGYRVCRSDPHRLPKGQTLLTARGQGIGDRFQEIGDGGREAGASRRERRGGRRQGGKRGRGGRRR